MTGPTGRWVSATDLAEYAYCPRAWYYRHHPPPEGPAPGSDRRSAYAALLIGALLLLAVGVGAWILFR